MAAVHGGVGELSRKTVGSRSGRPQHPLAPEQTTANQAVSPSREETSAQSPLTSSARRSITTWQHVLGWSLVLLMTGAQFVDLRHGITRPWVVSAQLLVCGAALLVAAPVAYRQVRMRRQAGTPGGVLTRTGWILCGGFTLIEAWALVSSLVAPQAVIKQGVVPRVYQVMPVVTGWVTMAAVLVVLLAIGQQGRARYVPLAAVGLLLGALADWPVQVPIHRSIRLASGMGGSAVIHVPIALAGAVLVDVARDTTGHAPGPAGGVPGPTWRTRMAWAGGGASVLMMLLTGSRAALIVLVATCLALVVSLRRQMAVRWLAAAALCVGIAVVAVCLRVSCFQRMLRLSSSRRMDTWTVGWQTVSSSVRSMLIGVGSGTMFPWYAIEAKLYPFAGTGMVDSRFGRALISAHSVYLEVLVELGAIMLVVLLVMVVALWRPACNVMSRGLGSHRHGVTVIVLAATTLAWAVDTYLVKGFAVSMWWWVVALCAVGLADERASAGQDGGVAQSVPSHRQP